MARLPRYVIPGQPQHIIVRGNNRSEIFCAESDYHFYLEKLQQACEKHGIDLHAYVLMTNHVHLLATPHEETSISKAMQMIGRYYVQYYNHCYQRSGTLWEGRYKATLIDSEAYLLICMRYIELNPVRANMVKHPSDYPWSSYTCYAQDHRWLGNGYFREQGAQIIASRKARADMEERGTGQLAALTKELREKIAGTKIVYPDRLPDKEETLKLGSDEIRILYFHGGHTPGDAVVWLPKSRILFSGDLIYVDRLLGILPFSNSKDWLASFEETEKLKPKIIVPGHGKVCDLPKAKKETGDYLSLLRKHMRKAYDAGSDLKKAIDTLDQRAYRQMELYEVLKGGNASRVYLEMESE